VEKNQIILETRGFVRNELENDSTGHDWWHIYRVTELTKTIAIQEGADIFICELAALLHDIADEKLNESEEAGLRKVTEWLQALGVDDQVKGSVLEIITTMSFKGGKRPAVRTIEAKVVQDADRLDAIGAIGIARTFAFSGARGQLIYNPEIPVREKMSIEEYRKRSPAVNHFYEKLFKLKDLMNTEYGKKLAQSRHRLMEEYLEAFYLEWDGKR
jgi:uncharacterized protein